MLRRPLNLIGGFAVAATVAVPAMAADPTEFLIIRGNLQIAPARVLTMNDTVINQREGPPLKISDTLAMLNPSPAAPGARAAGIVVLSDGQRIPGEPADKPGPARDTLPWKHKWLGHLEIPLDVVRSVVLHRDIEPPASSQNDVILLANGDRLEGVILSLGNPVTINPDPTDKAAPLAIPIERVAAVTLVSPDRKPAGRRVWINDGTVVDVAAIAFNDDGAVSLTGSGFLAVTPTMRISPGDIAAVQFDGAAMQALATISPSRIEGPATRYTLPRPVVHDTAAPLDLSSIEFSGPVVVRYALPAGCRRLATEAVLPVEARAWGDCEIIIRSDDSEAFRARLNATTPTASINVALPGRELTIEVTHGAHGPIQDVVVFKRAMLLRKP